MISDKKLWTHNIWVPRELNEAAKVQTLGGKRLKDVAFAYWITIYLDNASSAGNVIKKREKLMTACCHILLY